MDQKSDLQKDPSDVQQSEQLQNLLAICESYNDISSKYLSYFPFLKPYLFCTL